MLNPRRDRLGVFVTTLLAATAASTALAHDTNFSLLYAFEAPAPNTFTSPLGSQPDTRPVLGPGHSVYGMTYDGGANGNGVIYRYELDSGTYTLLHTFSALDANGYNDDGASPGVALTRGRDDVFYGVASYGGKNGNGTLFKITASGEFTVLHTFSALDANAHNEDGANPLRTVIIGDDGSLYGSTRLGGEHTCGTLPFLNSCGVAWRLDRSGKFSTIRQFLPSEGHAASLTQAWDGFLYGCAVWPATSLPSGAPLPSGILYRMASSGDYFEVLYTFSQTDSSGDNKDGADCYEPLVETSPGVFYGAATNGGANGNGVVFRYSLAKPHAVEIVHAFSALNAAGENADGAYPYARLTVGTDGAMYSTASDGGSYGNGVVYRIGCDGSFELLHTFSAVNAVTGSNADGATPDFGVVFDRDDGLIGMTDYGGKGSTAGIGNSGGTLYRIALHP
jgi:uncharacterized repeat protein (TIGR03803 family)